MSIRILTLATAAATTSAWAAAAQRNQQQLAGGGPMPMADSLPEECRTAVQVGGESHTVRNLDRQSASQVAPGMMGQHERGSEGLSAIDGENAGPMQMGIMAQDPQIIGGSPDAR
jgi:hypothetical protein